MEKLEMLYNVLKQAKESKKELVDNYDILSIRKDISSENFSTELHIDLNSKDSYHDLETLEYYPSTKYVDVVIKEKDNLFFIENTLKSRVNRYELETINNLTFEEIIPSFKEVEYNVKEAEKKLDKEIEESNKMENLLTNQLNNL